MAYGELRMESTRSDRRSLASSINLAPIAAGAAVRAPALSAGPALDPRDAHGAGLLTITPVVVGAAVEPRAPVEAEPVAGELAALKPATLERERSGGVWRHAAVT
jgi:hypothetical protein